MNLCEWYLSDGTVEALTNDPTNLQVTQPETSEKSRLIMILYMHVSAPWVKQREWHSYSPGVVSAAVKCRN